MFVTYSNQNWMVWPLRYNGGKTLLVYCLGQKEKRIERNNSFLKYFLFLSLISVPTQLAFSSPEEVLMCFR